MKHKYATLFLEFQAALDEYGDQERFYGSLNDVLIPSRETKEKVGLSKNEVLKLYNDLLTQIQSREENEK